MPPIRHIRHVFVALLATLVLPSTAGAFTFTADFVSSTYDTQPSDTFTTLRAQHELGTLIQTNVLTGFEDVNNTLHAAGVTQNYSILLTTSFTVAQAGHYSFQVGTDWGRGGAAAVIETMTGTILQEQVYDTDIWWAYNWNNPDVFTTEFDALAGESYTLQWVGFEGCCGGATTIRFSVDGAPFTDLNGSGVTGFFVPEPGTGAMLALGLLGLAVLGRPRPRA